MRPIRPLALALAFTAAALTAALAAPTPLAAYDCGVDYLKCIVTNEKAGTTDLLHETECHGGYARCIALLLLFH